MNVWQRVQYKALHACAALLIRGDAAGLRRVSKRLGASMWHLLPGRRRLAIQTISARLGLPEAEATAIARRSFDHNALSFLEMTLAPRYNFERPDLRTPDLGVFKDALALNRPIVSITGHLGAWELIAGMAGDLNLSERPNMIIVRNHSNPAIREFMTDMRASRGTEVVGHRNAAFTVLKTLRRNGVVGFLVDHNCSADEAVFLPFLGKTAAVNLGPAVLAVRAKALILPLFVVRDGDKYVFLVDQVLDTALLEGETDDRVQAVARFYTEAVERKIRAYPDQWFWMHKRWKTQPVSGERQA